MYKHLNVRCETNFFLLSCLRFSVLAINFIKTIFNIQTKAMLLVMSLTNQHDRYSFDATTDAVQ